jgi:hypothetical protein
MQDTGIELSDLRVLSEVWMPNIVDDSTKVTGDIIQKQAVDIESESLLLSKDVMCLADWRWAAKKGFWDSARRCWNEDLGGMKAYLAQRNLRREEGFDRNSRRLERTKAEDLIPRRHSTLSQGEGTFERHFYQAPRSGQTAYLHGSVGVDWFPPLTVNTSVGAGPLLDFMFRHGWGHLVLRNIWSAGYQASSIINIFNELPPSLYGGITEAIDSAQMAAACVAIHADLDVKSTEIATKTLQEQLELSEGGWEGEFALAIIELCFDPETQVRNGAAANSRAALLLGMERTELLSRLEKHDLPLPLAPLDAVAMFLYTLSVARDTVDTCYYRLTPSASMRLRPNGELPRPAELVFRTTVRDFDALGRLHKVHPRLHACIPVSVV